MLKEAIGTGSSVEEALESACAQLGLERDQVEFEILEMPAKKKFGLFGGSPAKVRAYVEESPADVSLKYLEGIFENMGASGANVQMEETEEGAVFTVTGDDLGFLIGRRGETLDAIQYLTGLVANRSRGSYYRITINSGNYREKREKTLIGLARKLANNTLRTGRNSSLEPMNPYERRIIHTAVQAVDGATSWSVGEEPNRHVIIGIDKNYKGPRPMPRGGKPYNRGGRFNKGGQRGGRPGGPRQDGQTQQQAGTAVQSRPHPAGKPSKKVSDVPLYGKIEAKKED